MITTYRVFVSTDLGGDPDDIQALFNLLHHSDILRIEGIGNCCGPKSTPRVEVVKEWVQRVDLDFLRSKGHTELMTEKEVIDNTVQGQAIPGAPSADRSTPSSRLLIERANEIDAEGRILWVLVWGSLTDVAQALYDEPSIANKIRINCISSSNTEADPESRDYVFNGMNDKWPNLWWIEDGILPKFSHETFRGVYLGGNQDGEWNNMNFIPANIKGRGTTHGGLFNEKCGDVYPVARWPEGTLKEGDAPTFLYLLSPVIGGVGDVDDPTQESWGGTFRKPYPDKYPNYYCDLDAPEEECQATINKYRTKYLSEWKRCWQWYDD